MIKREVVVLGAVFLGIVTIFLSYKALVETYYPPTLSSTYLYPNLTPEYIREHNKGVVGYDDAEVVIITASNEHFFDRMVNMIGSVHHWEPNLTIVAWDLGLTKKQIATVKRMCNVEKFHFENYGPYMKQLRFYAWKPLIIKETMEDYPLVFWEDSGQEFRAPITEIKNFIRSDGYFFDESDTNFNHFCPQVMYDALGIPDEKSRFEGLGGLHGAVLGFRRDSRAYSDVLLPSVDCSLVETCIAPFGTDLGNYRYDQSILSLYAHRNGPFIIRKESKFNACTVGYCPEFDQIRDSPDPDFQQSHRLILFSRRGFEVKPYKDSVCYRKPSLQEAAEEKKEADAQAKLDKKIAQVNKDIDDRAVQLGKATDNVMLQLMDKNRAILSNVKVWITEDVYKKSRNNYGIPDYIRHLIDKPVGDEMNIADVLTYIATAHMGKSHLKYLELGVSVGKTFSQMAASLSDSTLAVIELEDINPVMEEMLTDKHLLASWRYYSPFSAPRLTNDSCSAYKSAIGGEANDVIFVSGDVRDENSWVPLSGHKFNIIFSDAVHDPRSITTEMEFITKLDLLDPQNFLVWYDDLGGGMTTAFINNFFTLKQKFPSLDEKKNIGIVKARGWLGVEEYHHTNGLISSMDIRDLLDKLKHL